MTTIDLSKASAKELKEALRLKKEAEKSERESRRIAYESIRDEVIKNLKQEVIHACGVVESLYAKVVSDTWAFRSIMLEYGELREVQRTFTIKDDNFAIEVKSKSLFKNINFILSRLFFAFFHCQNR